MAGNLMDSCQNAIFRLCAYPYFVHIGVRPRCAKVPDPVALSAT